MEEEPQESIARGGDPSEADGAVDPPDLDAAEASAGGAGADAPGPSETASAGDAGESFAPGDKPKPLGRRAEAAAKKAAREAAKAAAKKEEEKKALEREIPADAYVVSLPTFEGPLDLLLHLIQKHELDILDIPVSFVTEKYLAYLEVMRKLSIDVASEYLVMAATLIHIKSKMLLPQIPGGQDEAGEEEEADPRAELVKRLLDYQKYKAASEELHDRDLLGHKVFPRGSGEIAPPGPAPFQRFGVFNLFDALEKVLSRTKAKVEHNVVFDRISITDRIVELTQRMKSRRQMLFEEMFEPDRSTFEVVITFLAVLEMCKLKLMRVYQADVLASIHVELLVVDEIAEGDELEFATVGGQSMAAGPVASPEAPADAATPEFDAPAVVADEERIAAEDDEGVAAEEPIVAEEPAAAEESVAAEAPVAAEPEAPVAAEPEAPEAAVHAEAEPAAENDPVAQAEAADAAFEAEFAALLAEEEATLRAAQAERSAAEEITPDAGVAGTTVDD